MKSGIIKKITVFISLLTLITLLSNALLGMHNSNTQVSTSRLGTVQTKTAPKTSRNIQKWKEKLRGIKPAFLMIFVLSAIIVLLKKYISDTLEEITSFNVFKTQVLISYCKTKILHYIQLCLSDGLIHPRLSL
jgi:uncharacterized membrane protein